MNIGRGEDVSSVVGEKSLEREVRSGGNRNVHGKDNEIRPHNGRCELLGVCHINLKGREESMTTKGKHNGAKGVEKRLKLDLRGTHNFIGRGFLRDGEINNTTCHDDG